MFESINEPQFAGTSGDDQNYQLLHELNAEFVRIVRQSGGEQRDPTPGAAHPVHQRRPGPAGRADDHVQPAATTRNLAATVHFYGCWPFSVNIAGGTRYDANVEQDLIGTFDRVYNTFVARGIPVIVGEWALLS